MAGPWEKYKTPSAKPWEKFAPTTPKADMSFLGRAKDNILGVDDGIDSTGEKVGSLVRGGIAAVARGMADIPALPANIAQLGAGIVEKAVGMDQPSMVSRAIDKLPDTRDMLGAIPVIGPESQFKAPGTAGDFVSTIGEFAGAAGGTSRLINAAKARSLSSVPSGASAGQMVRYGAIPGAASEGAGQLTEGTAAEPWARLGGGLLGSLFATPKPQQYGRGVLKVSDDVAESANYLASKGVRPSAGQVADADGLMKVEGTLSAKGSQIEDFTRAALQTTGNTTAKRATPAVLAQTQDDITGAMNRILDFDAPIPPTTGQKLMEVSDDFFNTSGGGNITPRLRQISEQLLDAATDPAAQTLPAARLREWRTSLGKYTTSGDEATRDAAHALRDIVDDVTHSALTQAGKTDDIATLADLRTKYRNFLTVVDASSRAGRDAARGLITPERLDSAATRVIGRRNNATGRGTEASKLARQGVANIGAKPTVTSGGIRDFLTGQTTALGLGGAGAGISLASGLGGPMTAGIAAGAAALPLAARGFANSGLLQSVLMDLPNLAKPLAGSGAGLLSQFVK